jgi:catechol 2,3-dioxygenase-like lactoylglutathione lyase family enzyme
MFRIRDPKVSLAFYQDIIGMERASISVDWRSKQG